MEIWSKVISQFMLPPAILIIISFIGLLASLRWRFYGMLTVTACLSIMYILSIPLTSIQLMSSLENTYPAINPQALQTEDPKPVAIVILSGGRYDNAPEYSPESITSHTLARLRFGARLQKSTQLPILVSGGLGTEDITPEAVLMKEVLINDFGIAARWVEDDSGNTMENALRTSEIFLKKDINRIYLVTHAFHMPRAVWAFTQTGLQVTPAPTQFTTISSHSDLRILEYLPSASALAVSSRALKERLGLLWYKLRYSPVKLAEMSRSPKKQREIADEKAARAAARKKETQLQAPKPQQKRNPARNIKPSAPPPVPPKAPAPPRPPSQS